MKSEIREYLNSSLEIGLDSSMQEFGFARRKNSVIYTRKFAESTQKIELAVEYHPGDRPDSTAAIYPWLEVNINSVEELLQKMVGDDCALLQGLPNITLRQPIEFTSGKAEHARWFIFQSASLPEVVGEIKSFVKHWTIPFLEMYSTPSGICNAYASADPRVLNDLRQKLRVAAAMILCGRSADSFAIIDRWFGKAGLRKRYQPIFTYMAANS